MIVIKAAMMGVGIAMVLMQLKAEQPDGLMLVIAGGLFGMGLHWYRKGFSWKTKVVGICMAAATPALVGAVVMQQWLLALIGLVFVGVAGRMFK